MSARWKGGGGPISEKMRQADKERVPKPEPLARSGIERARAAHNAVVAKCVEIAKERDDARAEVADWRGMMPPGVARPDCVVLSERELDGMRRELARLRPWREMAEKLDTVLTPMAKGYAREHPVGRNAEMIAETIAALDALRAGEKEDG